jgi:hypothetical protein
MTRHILLAVSTLSLTPRSVKVARSVVAKAAGAPSGEAIRGAESAKGVALPYLLIDPGELRHVVSGCRST